MRLGGNTLMNIYKETNEKSFIEISHDETSSTPTEKNISYW